MATTNYRLPTILGTNAFDLVTDYNALSNATDAALANVAKLIPTESITEMHGQISALQKLTGSQNTDITTLKSKVTTANNNISTLESGLKTANNNIGTLQTGLQGANANIQTINANIQAINKLMKPFTLISNLNLQTSSVKITGNVFCNAAAKILIFSLNANITYNFTNGTIPAISAFGKVLPDEYRPTQDRRIFIGDAMSGTAAANLQLDINVAKGTITPVVGGINRVNGFYINGNGILMYDIPADGNNS